MGFEDRSSWEGDGSAIRAAAGCDAGEADPYGVYDVDVPF